MRTCRYCFTARHENQFYNHFSCNLKMCKFCKVYYQKRINEIQEFRKYKLEQVLEALENA